jgi:hypothetical protein
MTRTPEEIYEEIRAVPQPPFSKGLPAAEKLAYAEAQVARWVRVGALWGELYYSLHSTLDTPAWSIAAASGAQAEAFERQLRAEEYRDSLVSDQVSAGTT